MGALIILNASREPEVRAERARCDALTQKYHTQTAHTEAETDNYLYCNPLESVTYILTVGIVLSCLLYLVYAFSRRQK